MTGQQKIGRNFRLTLQPLDGGAPIIITMPITISFNLQRILYGGINILDLDVFNLSVSNQRRIYQDQNVLGEYFNSQQIASGASPKFFNIILEAGYGNQLHKIFDGHILWANSSREGTNIITHIHATSYLFDLVGTQVNTTIQAPTTAQNVINFLITQFPNLKVGAIGNFPYVYKRPVVLCGPAWELLRIYAGGGSVFIDDGKVFVLNNQEVTGGVFVVNDATGILQTPKRQQNLLMVTTLMETGVQLVGQSIQIQSTVLPIYNGIYKVLGIQHRGMISGAVCGKMESVFTLQAPGLYGAPNISPPGGGFTVVPLAQAVAS